MAAKRSSRGSAAKIRVYIQDDNHDKENIEDQDHIDKISFEERVNSQELEETPQKRKRIIKRSSWPDIMSNRRIWGSALPLGRATAAGELSRTSLAVWPCEW